MAPSASTEPSPLALHQLPGQLVTEDDIKAEHWYECAPEWPSPQEGGPRGTTSQWKQVADAALQSATRAYDKQTGTGKNLSAALAKEKTIRDKIASLTLRVQESPLHRLEELRSLQSMAKKKERRESLPAAEALKDLFVNDLLPSDRRLARFEDREFECGKKNGISKRHLAYAWFESELKAVYRTFLTVLEELAKDNLTHFKEKAVKYVSELLVAKPECERELLAMVVNKLGDPDRKVSSTSAYNLRMLIEKYHPQMRTVVVKEVEQLIVRTNVSQKAQYYAVNFLNQIQFTADDVDLARWVLRIYMDLFTLTLNKSNQPQEDTQSAKKVDVKQKGKKKKKKKEVQRVKEISSQVRSSRLMGALLIGANRAYPYTKPEQDDTSYQHHYDSLFQVAHSDSLEPATHALAFLHQVSQSESTQGDRFYRALYSRIFDAADAADSKQAGFLNLLYKAIKHDTNPRRVKSFLKRLLQAAACGSPSFAGACTVLLSQCFKGKQFGALKSFISIAELSDEVERFVDADKQAAVVEVEPNKSDSKANGKADEMNEGDNEGGNVTDLYYNPSKRDPQYAGAEKSRLWELVTLCGHFHPSVAMFARSMCHELRNFEYPGDPLKDFSQIAFLDKFVYKKPKNRVAKSLYGKRAASYRDDPVPNSREFQELVRTGRVGEDDKFYVRFFKWNPNRVVGEDEDEEEKKGEDSEEETVEEAMQAEVNRLNADEGNGSGEDETMAGGINEEEMKEMEAAFEEILLSKMKSLGADSGLVSGGINKMVDDVDEEDEEEMKAFEEAFGSELERLDEKGAEEKDKLSKGKKNKKRKREKGSKSVRFADEGVGSVFAAAEDYAEDIEQGADGKGDNEEVEGTKNEQDRKVRRRKKRKTKK